MDILNSSLYKQGNCRRWSRWVLIGFNIWDGIQYELDTQLINLSIARQQIG